jgi:pyruvate-formate lyase-activating enzyme
MTRNKPLPRLLYANDKGRFFDAPGLALAGMSGGHRIQLTWDDLIPLPLGSDLFMLPGRSPIGYDEETRSFAELDDLHTVTAFVAPAYTLRAHVAFRSRPGAEAIPLNAYAPVGFHDGRYYVPAFRVDPDPRQDCERLDFDRMAKNRDEDLAQFGPDNRALNQMIQCAFETGCPAARNYFHRRWEAPMPTSVACNARCVGCLSFQPKGVPPSPMNRLKCPPKAEELAALMVPHLEKAEEAVASFGQGCEGEPLTQASLLEETLRLIRSKTSRGTLNLNTNASRPKVVEALFGAGLDSIRVSLNSAQEDLYLRYHRPVDYTFEDVRESLRIARRLKKFVSLNYFVFPGVSDQEMEALALLDLLDETRPDFIQMRNLNMDPDQYLETVGRPLKKGLGVDRLMEMVHSRFPSIRFGYYNPPREKWGHAGIVPPEQRKLSISHEKGRHLDTLDERVTRDCGE